VGFPRIPPGTLTKRFRPETAKQNGSMDAFVTVQGGSYDHQSQPERNVCGQVPQGNASFPYQKHGETLLGS